MIRKEIRKGWREESQKEGVPEQGKKGKGDKKEGEKIMRDCGR